MPLALGQCIYGLAAAGGAMQNAHGRFALAAAAPAIENIGMIATMVVLGLAFPSGLELVLLGLGTTGSVALHSAIQWIGAWRCGFVLVPRLGWRDPEVADVIRKLRPSLGYAGLNSVRIFAATVVANQVAGGVVAFTLALNFYYLPVAVFARPVTTALLPRLARLARTSALAALRAEAVRGAGLALLLVVPASVAFMGIADAMANVVTYGEMTSAAGRAALAVSLATLALGVIGEAGFVVDHSGAPGTAPPAPPAPNRRRGPSRTLSRRRARPPAAPAPGASARRRRAEDRQSTTRTAAGSAARGRTRSEDLGSWLNYVPPVPLGRTWPTWSARARR